MVWLTAIEKILCSSKESRVYLEDSGSSSEEGDEGNVLETIKDEGPMEDEGAVEKLSRL